MENASATNESGLVTPPGIPAAVAPITLPDGTVIPHSGYLLHPDHPTYGQARSLLSGAWKREELVSGKLGVNSGQTFQWLYTIFTGEGDGISQLRDINVRIAIEGGNSDQRGFIQLVFLRWNSGLVSSINSTIWATIDDDYRVNIRERMLPQLSQRDTLYETRFKGLRLRSNERFGIAKVFASYSTDINMGTTFSYRELDKGDI